MTSPRDLIKQGLEHDERMSEAPWYTSNGGLGVTYGADREWVLRIARVTPVSDAAGIAWLRNHARALLTGYAAALDENERLGEYLRVSNGARMFDQLGADRMADEIDALIKRRVIDSRSPAADALLDYRDPPRTPRSDRLGALEAERDTWSRDRGEFNRLKHSDVEQGRRIAELLAENDRLRAESVKPHPLSAEKQCPACGKMSRTTTAGCDHCDLEDK